jgi:AraC-like DNA-binding protein
MAEKLVILMNQVRPVLDQRARANFSESIMGEDSDFIAPIRIVTKDLPEKDRLAIWIGEIRGTILKLDFSPIPEVPFHQGSTLRRLPRLGMATWTSAGLRTFRTRQNIAQGEGGWSFIINRGGRIHCSQSGKDATLAPAAPEYKLLGTTFANHVYDLLGLMLRPNRENLDNAKGGPRAARLHAIKTSIVARFTRSDLSVSTVAASEGVSPRHVQRLFEEEGTSFSAFVPNERLARVHNLLSDPYFARGTIAAIVFEAGFSDLSNFNRFFRRRYGVTPSDVRVVTRHLSQPF